MGLQSGTLGMIVLFLIIVIKCYILTINTIMRMLCFKMNKNLPCSFNFIGESEVVMRSISLGRVSISIINHHSILNAIYNKNVTANYLQYTIPHKN